VPLRPFEAGESVSNEQTKEHIINRLKSVLRWCTQEASYETEPGEFTRARSGRYE